jgi:hypothetical protein
MKQAIYSHIPLFLAVITCLFSCKAPENKDRVSVDKPAREAPEITLEPLKNIPLEEAAIFRMNYPGEYQTLDAGEHRFSYETVNFRLGEETVIPGYNLKNSKLGRHITLVLNNESIIHNSLPEFEVRLEPGHYTALSFLTRSNYESLKGPDAYVIRQFDVGKGSKEDLDLSGPNLFYHMPSGSYSGKAMENIMLDFFIINCSLSADSYKVQVAINDTLFIVDDWVPYIIRGLPEGESTITLELIDGSGERVSPPFNSISRKIILADLEPA